MPRRSIAASFLLVLFATVAWQALYCGLVADGNPTALFFIGRLPEPPELNRGAYLYPHSLGYDGQLYRIVAHDPLLRKDYGRYLDDPRYRYRRILVPGLAALLGGEGRGVDIAYIVITDLLLAAGGVCFAALAAPALSATAAAALYCVIPAVIASADRMVTDGLLVAGFLAALLFYRRRRIAPLAAVAALLPLVREVGVLVWAGLLAACALGRRWREAAILASSSLPWLAWFGFVYLHTPPSHAAEGLITPPVIPIVRRLFTMVSRPVAPAVNAALQAMDVAACAALLFALAYFAWCAWTDWRRRREVEETAVVGPIILLAACSGGATIVGEPYDLMRVTSVVLVWAALRLLPRRRWAAVAVLAAPALPLLVYRLPPLLRLFGGA